MNLNTYNNIDVSGGDGLNPTTPSPLSTHKTTNTYLPSFQTATVNCRGLRKSNNPTVSSQFIRHLRSLSLDILALQETHTSTSFIQEQFHS